MNRISDYGAPTRNTVGEVGQHYEDLNTGDIYECVISSEHSKLHGDIMGGYIWERKFSGEDRDDHEAIFSGGASSWYDLTDKPFGENFEVDMLWEGTFETTTTDDEDNPWVRVTTLPEDGYSAFTSGKTYKVEFDGVEYMCEYVYGNFGGTFYSFGDVFLKWESMRDGDHVLNGKVHEDTGEPFLLFQYGSWWYLYTKEAGEHTIAVYDMENIVERIDAKFLPWLVVWDDGDTYSANMTYDEAVDLWNRRSLMGGYIHDAEGMKLFTHIGYTAVNNYFTLIYQDGELMFDDGGVQEAMPM